MNRPCFFALCDMLRHDPVFINASNVPQAPVEYQVLLTLRRLGMDGDGVSLGQLASKFSVAGESKRSEEQVRADLRHRAYVEGTVELWSLRVIEAINRQMHRQISWPDVRERRIIASQIGRDSPFPDCVGFVDGTAIQLAYTPGVEDRVDYFCYKGFYALQLMAVCDHKKMIRNILLGFPGSANDSRVYSYTEVSQRRFR